MKHPTRFYAQALAAVLAEKPQAEKKIIRNFLQLLQKNGEEHKLKHVLKAAEKLFLQKEGRRKVVLESARPLSEKHKKLLTKVLKPGDVVEEKVSPELVAGVRIAVNDELQLDATLQRKLRKMLISRNVL
ncbi:MAG: F0F1 ATP synthase subunit delta [candidate division KSB1 bacterium]|nr:F0F1 ATP synthase subunit delta [candidate division KSB1 bacterium]